MDDFKLNIDDVPTRIKERARAFHVDGYDDSFVVQGTNRQVSFVSTDTIDSDQFRSNPVASIQSTVQLDYLHLIVLGFVCFIVGVNVALWFCRHPFLSATKVDGPSKEVIKDSHNQREIDIPSSSEVAPIIPTCIGPLRHGQQNSLSIGLRASDDPPHLIPDDEDHHKVHRRQEHEQPLRVVQVIDPLVTSNAVMSTTSTAISSSVEIKPSSALTERPESNEESVQSLMHFAQLTKQNSRVMGLNVDDNVILQTASKLYLHRDKTRAGRSREARQYCFMHNQNEMNRQQNERHHVENQDATREEPDWRKKVLEKRNAAFDALSKSVAQTCAAIFVSSLVVPLYLNFKAWRDLGYGEIFCYGAGTSMDPLARNKEEIMLEPNEKATSGSWSGWFWNSDNAVALFGLRRVWTWPSFDSIADFGFGETLSCIVGTMSHGAYYFLAVLVLSGGLCFVAKLSLPRFIQQAIQWGVLVGWLMANEWVPHPPCQELTLLALILYLLGILPIQLRYTKIKGSLEREKGVPHAVYVNKLCDWFDQATFCIRLVPLGFGGVYIAVVVYTELGEWIQYL